MLYDTVLACLCHAYAAFCCLAPEDLLLPYCGQVCGQPRRRPVWLAGSLFLLRAVCEDPSACSAPGVLQHQQPDRIMHTGDNSSDPCLPCLLRFRPRSCICFQLLTSHVRVYPQQGCTCIRHMPRNSAKLSDPILSWQCIPVLPHALCPRLSCPMWPFCSCHIAGVNTHATAPSLMTRAA